MSWRVVPEVMVAVDGVTLTVVRTGARTVAMAEIWAGVRLVRPRVLLPIPPVLLLMAF